MYVDLPSVRFMDGSVYLSTTVVLDTNIIFLLQAGLIRKWTADVMRKARRKNKKEPVMEYEKENEEGAILALTLVHMQGPLLLYLASIVVSFIAFLSENLLAVFLQNHFRQRKLQ